MTGIVIISIPEVKGKRNILKNKRIVTNISRRSVFIVDSFPSYFTVVIDYRCVYLFVFLKI